MEQEGPVSGLRALLASEADGAVDVDVVDFDHDRLMAGDVVVSVDYSTVNWSSVIVLRYSANLTVAARTVVGAVGPSSSGTSARTLIQRSSRLDPALAASV